jgi:hypothetical protein
VKQILDYHETLIRKVAVGLAGRRAKLGHD